MKYAAAANGCEAAQSEKTTPGTYSWRKYEGLDNTPEYICRFLTRARHGSAFQNPRWHLLNEEKAERYITIAALQGGDPVFASLIRKTWVPGTRYFAGIVQRGPVFEDIQTAVGLWDVYESQLVQSGLCVIEIQPFWRREAARELKDHLEGRGYQYSHNGGHTESLALDLTPSEEIIFSRLTSSRRRQIRKAVKIGIEVRSASNREEMEKFWELYRDMCQSKNIGFMPRKAFESIRRFSDQSPSDCACLLGWLNGELVGGNIVLRHSGIAEYTSGAGSIKINNGVPKTDLIHWESILWAKKQGAAVYDLGGFKSDAEEGSHIWGINRFKLEFTKNRIELLEPMQKVFNNPATRIFKVLKTMKRTVFKCFPLRRLG
jgi:lipid II:glycine glycyltransferase (peptidoglycan interpeptide bridge formation enzyme)